MKTIPTTSQPHGKSQLAKSIPHVIAYKLFLARLRTGKQAFALIFYRRDPIFETKVHVLPAIKKPQLR